MENRGTSFYILDYGLTSADPILVIYRPRNLYIDMVPGKRSDIHYSWIPASKPLRPG
jgi:hypothetical protein